MTIYKLQEIRNLPKNQIISPEKYEIDALPNAKLCIVLGNFDGVHLGHRVLLDRAVSECTVTEKCLPVVWTFFPSDTAEIKKAPLLTGLAERLRLFAEAGIEYAVFTEFDSVRQMTPEQFAEKILLGINTQIVICGYNYRFGYLGAGDTEMLRTLLYGKCQTIVIPPVCIDGKTVNSTLIRSYIEAGFPDKAAQMLGRPFSVCFPVIHGNEIGRKIGVPTINQTFPKGYIIPQNGVYICTCIADGLELPAITNVGSRPTVNEDENNINCETHIIDYHGYLYGEAVRVNFHEKIRGEIKFPDIQTLKSQIGKDMLYARRYFDVHKTDIK